MAAPMRKSCRLMFNLIKRHICQSYRSYASIKELLKHNGEQEKSVIAQGWLTSFRRQKRFTFFQLNDGTATENLQVVSDTDNCDRDLGIRCSVRVEGNLVKSQGSGQALEIQAKTIHLLGKCDLEEYPFKPRQKYTHTLMREHLHLRPRMDHCSSLLKVRNAATMAVHRYFQENDFLFVHTPIITSNDCEGAGETFLVQGKERIPVTGSESDSEGTDVDSEGFFGVPAFLTVSGQLHLEAITGQFLKAYNFGPTFRAENAVGRHHLSEFYMIEAELAFLDSLEQLMEVMESLVKSVTQDVVTQSSHHMDVMRKSGSNDSSAVVDAIINKRFERMTYSEAVKILEKNNSQFMHKVSWGCDLQKEHEKFLVQHCGNIPVFVTDFPDKLKPFYARENPDKETVAAVDLLAPEVGELIGGSLREERLDVLQERMDKQGLKNSLDWYLDLRRYGSVPHGGFGLGFERYLQCILGVPNIKDTIPFPRWSQHCAL